MERVIVLTIANIPIEYHLSFRIQAFPYFNEKRGGIVVTAAEALQTHPLNRCRIVAGHNGLGREVRSVSVMDAPDPALWLKKGDLILTTGYLIQNDAKAQMRLIQDLHSLGGGGLGIKVKRFLPAIPEPMVKEADRLGMPLFEIPYDLPFFSDMIFALTRAIIDHRSRFIEQAEGQDFFSDLLKGSLSDERSILRKGRPYGLLPDREYIVLCIGVYSERGIQGEMLGGHRFFQIVKEVETEVDGKLFGTSFDAYVVVVQTRSSSGQSRPMALARKVASLFMKHFAKVAGSHSLSVGIGNPKQNISDIPVSYREAKEAIYLGKRVLKSTNEFAYEYAALEPDALLQHLPDALLQQYVTGTLNPLIQYDREMGTDLLNTLDIYLEQGRHIGHTAEIMYIHRNTVKFRVARIEELLGVDLMDGDVVFRLRLGLRIFHLLKGSRLSV